MPITTTPSFAVVPQVGVGAVSTANTSRDGTGTIVTILSASAAGTKINEIVVHATSDPADSIVTVFLHDGSTAYLFDEFDLGNPTAASSVTTAARLARGYANVVLPSGWSVRAAITAAPTAGVVNVFVLGADLT